VVPVFSSDKVNWPTPLVVRDRIIGSGVSRQRFPPQCGHVANVRRGHQGGACDRASCHFENGDLATSVSVRQAPSGMRNRSTEPGSSPSTLAKTHQRCEGPACLRFMFGSNLCRRQRHGAGPLTSRCEPLRERARRAKFESAPHHELRHPFLLCARVPMGGTSLTALPSPPSHGECTRKASGQSTAESGSGHSADRAGLFSQALSYFFRVIGTSSIRTPTASVNRVGHGRHDRQRSGPWPDFLGAKGPRDRVPRPARDSRACQAKWGLLYSRQEGNCAQGVESLLGRRRNSWFFHEGFAEPHVDAALDLTSTRGG